MSILAIDFADAPFEKSTLGGARPSTYRRPGAVGNCDLISLPETEAEMITPLAYIGAAIAEIVGCFAFWAWLRLDRSVWWLVPGMVSLAAFAYLLTLVESEAAGRAYAAYGGVYIVASICWLWIEGNKPDRWDVIGATICLIGAGVILLAPRQG